MWLVGRVDGDVCENEESVCFLNQLGPIGRALVYDER